MPNRMTIAILAALFFGFITAYGIYNFLRQQQQAREALKLATQNVVTAGKDIPAGTTVTEKMVKEGTIKVTSWPKASVPPGSFSLPQQVVGKVVRVKTVAGEPLLESRMAGEGAGLTVRLTPGHRAMAVKVDEIIGVSGFIVPDDRVDVIASVAPPGRSAQDDKISRIVLQNKRVLSVAQSVEQREGKPQVARSITLEVTPEEAEKLSVAQIQGDIILALRAIGDDNAVSTRGSTKRDLLAIAAPRAPRGKGVTTAAPAEKYKVEVYMGNERSVKEF